MVDRAQGLISGEYFTVDGTLIEAWAGQKSFQRKDGDGPGGSSRDFRRQSRTNETHVCTTDPDARLYRRTNHGGANLSYLGHLLIEIRHGLIADARATQADGFAEREAGLWMLHVQGARRPSRHRTVGAEKRYDVRDLLEFARDLGFTPHVTRDLTRPVGAARSTSGPLGIRATRRANTLAPALNRRSRG